MTVSASRVHDQRRALREALGSGRRLVGTFVKLAAVDVIELAHAAGFDFVVVDLEHSVLGEADAIGLVRHAEAVGLPALVRIPSVDAASVNRLLENGAAGIQLSMLSAAGQSRALRAATRFAPEGARSVSLANRVAGHGAVSLAEFLGHEVDSPPLLVGQIETAVDEPWPEVLAGLDVVFVGTTDLAVSTGALGDDATLGDSVARIRDAAGAAGVAFGGWAPTLAAAPAKGLAGAGYVVVGSDLQVLGSGLRAAARADEEDG